MKRVVVWFVVVSAVGAGTNAGAAIITGEPLSQRSAGFARTDPTRCDSSKDKNCKRASSNDKSAKDKKKPAADKPKPTGTGGKDPSAPTHSENEQLGRDPFRAMGGNSPMCRRGGLAAKQRANCRSSGSLAHRYPIDRYGFDIHIKTGVSSIPGNIWYAVQSIALFVWMGLLYILKGVLLLLEWAFSLDLIGDTMPSLRTALKRLHQDVLGEPWFLAAIAFAGLWGIYRGLIQRRTIQTLSGLAATVGMMVALLVVIARPGDTVGRVHELSSKASLAIVSGATTGTFNNPERGFSRAISRIFDTLALRPWCALEFSDVDFCLSSPRKVIGRDDLPDDPKILQAAATSPTVGDMWLRFDANGDEKNDQRNQIYEKWKEKEGGRLQAVIRIQKRGPTAARLALLTLISVGLVGAILTLGWIGLRLLGYSVMALILTLFAPVFFLVAVMGDSGRLTVIAWAKRLLGALAASFIYSILLAVVIVGATLLSSLGDLGWVAVWMLQIVFWWSLFLKRNEILAFASAPAERAGGMPNYLAWRTGLAAAAGALGGSKQAGQVATGKTQEVRAQKKEATKRAISQSANEKLTRRAEQAKLSELGEAKAKLDRAKGIDERVRHIDRQLGGYHERSELAAARGEQQPPPGENEKALLARRKDLTGMQPPASELERAKHTVDQAERNRGAHGSVMSPRDHEVWQQQRRADLERPADHASNLRAAGIAPEAYRDADPQKRAALRERAEERMRSDRELLAAVPAKPGAHVQPTAIKRARRELDPGLVKQRTQEQRRQVRSEHKQMRRERKLARARGHLRPPGPPRR